MNLMTKDDLKRFEENIKKEVNQQISQQFSKLPTESDYEKVISESYKTISESLGKLPDEEQYKKAISEGLKESNVATKRDIEREFSSLNKWAKILFFLSFISMTLTWILSIMVK